MIDTRELGRRPGSMRRYTRAAVPPDGLDNDVVSVAPGGEIELEIRLESVMEGVLASASATVPISAECSRCLDPVTDTFDIEITELFAYPDSATDDTTDEDEVSRVVNDLVDLEPALRDAVILALPQAPLCSPDCPGLCPECGAKWAVLPPDHGHETIDARWAALAQHSAAASSATSAGNNEEKK